MEQRLRAVLWGVAAVVLTGSALELALLEHWEDPVQGVPFALSLIGLLAIGAAWWSPGPATLKAVRWVMLLLAAGAVVGVWQHLHHNYEFAAEIAPTRTMGFWLAEAISGANPLLAPGIFAVVAAMGLGAAWDHPSESSQN